MKCLGVTHRVNKDTSGGRVCYVKCLSIFSCKSSWPRRRKLQLQQWFLIRGWHSNAQQSRANHKEQVAVS